MEQRGPNQYQMILTNALLKIESVQGNLAGARGLDWQLAAGVDLQSGLDRFWNDELKSVCEAAFESGESGTMLQERLLRGVPIALQFSVSPRVVERHIQGVHVDIQDVTLTRRLASQRQLREKMQNVANVVSQMVHRINNPIAAILNRIGLLLVEDEEKLKVPDLREELKQVQEEIYSLSLTTNSLSVFSEDEQTSARFINVNELLKNSIELANLVHSEAKTEFKLMLDDDLPPILGDEITLEQCFVNIFRNAVETTGKNGTVKILGEVENRFGDFVKIMVIDNGPGISAHVVNDIFDPFFTTKEGHNGLGLSVAYAIVANHNGMIEAFTEAGQGTSIIVSLPVARM